MVNDMAWIAILLLCCALIGGYVYLVEYHGTGGNEHSAPDDTTE
jgi:hypothetical protein